MSGHQLPAVLLLALLCLLGATSPASAQAAAVTVEDGWWWSVQPDPPVLPQPPTVPEDGLRVSAAPAGESSVTAVRLITPPALQTQSVTLRIASQRGLFDDALVALPTSAAFDGGTRAGPGSKAPAPEEGAAPLPVLVDLDGGTVTVDLVGSLGVRAFVLQPATLPSTSPRDLDVSFEPVSAADVRTGPAGSGGPPALPPPPAPAPAPAEAAPPGQDGFTLPAVPLAAAAPVLPGLAPRAEPAPAPAVAPAAPGAVLTAARPVVPSALAADAFSRSRTLGLLAIGLAALMVLRQQGRPRRARLSLHALPEPGAQPLRASTAARPPRLR